MSSQDRIEDKIAPRRPESSGEPASVFDVEATKEIFTQLKKINDALPGAHQTLLAIVENAGSNPPRPRTYATYQEIMDMVASGVTVYTTSKRLKIPYSTCHAYTKMTKEQVAKLKASDGAAAAAAPAPAEEPPAPAGRKAAAPKAKAPARKSR